VPDEPKQMKQISSEDVDAVTEKLKEWPTLPSRSSS
jgi:hypothetical protein